MKTSRINIKTICLYGLLVLLSITILLPFLWMVSSSLKTSQEVFSVPMKWLPEEPVWENFREIWTKIPLLMFFKNSFKLAIIITVLQVLTSSFAAYPFAKMKFPGKDIIFLGYIATIAVPWQVYMVPQFIMIRKMQLADTHLSLILMQASVQICDCNTDYFQLCKRMERLHGSHDLLKFNRTENHSAGSSYVHHTVFCGL